jgi:hypothetical protein
MCADEDQPFVANARAGEIKLLQSSQRTQLGQPAIGYTSASERDCMQAVQSLEGSQVGITYLTLPIQFKSIEVISLQPR